MNILKEYFGTVKLPKQLYDYHVRAGVPDLAIHPNGFILTKTRLITLTGRKTLIRALAILSLTSSFIFSRSRQKTSFAVPEDGVTASHGEIKQRER